MTELVAWKGSTVKGLQELAVIHRISSSTRLSLNILGASGYIRELFLLPILSVDEAQSEHESEFEELEAPSLPQGD